MRPDIISVTIPDGPNKLTQITFVPSIIAFTKSVLDNRSTVCYTDITTNGGATIRLFDQAATQFVIRYEEWLSKE